MPSSLYLPRALYLECPFHLLCLENWHQLFKTQLGRIWEHLSDLLIQSVILSSVPTALSMYVWCRAYNTILWLYKCFSIPQEKIKKKDYILNSVPPEPTILWYRVGPQQYAVWIWMNEMKWNPYLYHSCQLPPLTTLVSSAHLTSTTMITTWGLGCATCPCHYPTLYLYHLWLTMVVSKTH